VKLHLAERWAASLRANASWRLQSDISSDKTHPFITSAVGASLSPSGSVGFILMHTICLNSIRPGDQSSSATVSGIH
jgi:hypothetical protein